MTSSEPIEAQNPNLWRRLVNRFGSGGLTMLVTLALIFAAALHHTLDGRNPWDKDIARRVAEGLTHRPKEYGIIGMWWGCVAVAGISGVLLLGARLWLPGGSIQPRRAPFIPPAPSLLAITIAVIVMASAAGLRAPRLNQSLWNDEEYAMRRFAHGWWEQAKSTAGGQNAGEWKFKPVDWNATLFESKNGNNHLLSSLLDRWALDVWRFCTGEPREAFSEAAVRMPSLIAGILTLALLAAIGTELAWPWIGVGAAGLLAFHPWHIRYAVESKGYSLMLFFLCLSLLGLIRALRANKTAAWLCFAIGEAGFLLSFAGSLYATIGINLIAVLELLFRKEWRRLGPLIGFNLLAAIPVIVWTLPSVPQIMAYLAKPDALRLGMDMDWLRDAFSHVIAGIHFVLAEPEIHHGPSWIAEANRSRLFTVIVGWVIPGLAGAGLLAALLRNSAARLAIVGPVLGGGLAYLHNWWENNPMVVWYLIYLLVPLSLAVPLAIGRLLPHRERLHGAFVILVVTLFAAAIWRAGITLVKFDRQPMKQTIALIRDERPEAATAVFGVSDRQTMSYDPRVRVMETPADLEQAIASAVEEGRPLFVYFCGRTESGKRNPDLMKRVTDPAAFKHIADLPGLEAMFSYHVYEWIKPRSAAQPENSDLR